MERTQDNSGSVRSVERALNIIELLGEHQALGLEELHYLTALPKATVSRMLSTLHEQGWVYRGLADRRYRLKASCLYGDARLRERRQLVECAAPGLEALSERTGLVADLSEFDGEHLTLVESNIPTALRKRYPKTFQNVGHRPSLFHSAMGKACLNQLSDVEVQRLGIHNHIDDTARQSMCGLTRSQGFGQRTQGHWEYPVKLPFHIRAVALPVTVHGRLVASMALHWPEDCTEVERHLDTHLGHLMSTVTEVQRALGLSPRA